VHSSIACRNVRFRYQEIKWWQKKIVEKIRKELKANLKTNGIKGAAVKGREKNVFSIYKKIKTKHKPFSEY
jgi:(p)ppGpp synthase/HD superfamily hydrolase